MIVFSYKKETIYFSNFLMSFPFSGFFKPAWIKKYPNKNIDLSSWDKVDNSKNYFVPRGGITSKAVSNARGRKGSL